MAELSKFLKIVLIINLIAALFYGIMYLFLTNLWATLIDPSDFDLHLWRLFGGTCISLGIFGVVGLIRNEWTHLKILFETTILWLIVVDILNIISLIQIPRSPTNLVSQVTDVIVIFILIILDIIAYFKENKG